MTTMTEATTHTLDVRDAVLSYDRARWRALVVEATGGAATRSGSEKPVPGLWPSIAVSYRAE